MEVKIDEISAKVRDIEYKLKFLEPFDVLI